MRRCARPAALMSSVQPGQTQSEETVRPPADVHGAASELFLDTRVGQSLSEEQDQIGSLTVRAAPPAGSRALGQFRPFCLGHDRGVGGFEQLSRSGYAIQMSVTVH